jgi:hypothetical protein
VLVSTSWGGQLTACEHPGCGHQRMLGFESTKALMSKDRNFAAISCETTPSMSSCIITITTCTNRVNLEHLPPALACSRRTVDKICSESHPCLSCLPGTYTQRSKVRIVHHWPVGGHTVAHPTETAQFRVHSLLWTTQQQLGSTLTASLLLTHSLVPRPPSPWHNALYPGHPLPGP